MNSLSWGCWVSPVDSASSFSQPCCTPTQQTWEVSGSGLVPAAAAAAAVHDGSSSSSLLQRSGAGCMPSSVPGRPALVLSCSPYTAVHWSPVQTETEDIRRRLSQIQWRLRVLAAEILLVACPAAISRWLYVQHCLWAGSCCCTVECLWDIGTLGTQGGLYD